MPTIHDSASVGEIERKREGESKQDPKRQAAAIKRFLKGRPKSRVIVETCAESFRVADGANWRIVLRPNLTTRCGLQIPYLHLIQIR